jgi:hypothetical protein
LSWPQQVDIKHYVQRFSLLLVNLLIMIGSTAACGQDNVWQGPTNSSWFTPSNWSTGTPTSSDAAIVNNGTVAQIDAEGAVANSLVIGQTTPGSTVEMLSGSTLSVNNPLVIGPDGPLLFNGGGSVGRPSVQDNGTVEFEGSTSYEIGVPVSGTGKLVLNITGTLLVSSTTTYSGPTTVIAGTFQAESTGVFSPNSAFTVTTLQNPFISNTIVMANVITAANAVEIEGTQGSFATTPGVAITPNELAVAKALDSARGDPREGPCSRTSTASLWPISLMTLA